MIPPASKSKIVHNLKCIQTEGRAIAIAGKPYDYWVKKFGLPLYINFEDVAIENIRAFKRVFKGLYPAGRVCFAMKAYCHPRMAQIAAAENIGADIVSENELRCALEGGINPRLIELNGNIKTEELIKQAIQKQITIVADNIEDFKIIAALALKAKTETKIMLRVSGLAVEGATEDSVLTAHEWTKFGEHKHNIPAFIKTIKEYKYVDFLGFHTHIGTQITDLNIFLAALKDLLALSLLLQKSGIPCKTINIGGGFPIQYFTGPEWRSLLAAVKKGLLNPEKAVIWANGGGGFQKLPGGGWDFTRWSGEQFHTKYPKAKMLEAILKASIDFKGRKVKVLQALKELHNPEFIIEPGRAIITDTGIVLMRAGYNRRVNGHNMASAFMGTTNFGESLFYPNPRKWLIVNEHKKTAAKPYECFIAGNLCFSGDMLSKYKVKLQRAPEPGDVLMAYDTGGTGQHFLASNANSFSRTVRLLVRRNGQFTVIRRRETYEDIFDIMELS